MIDDCVVHLWIRISSVHTFAAVTSLRRHQSPVENTELGEGDEGHRIAAFHLGNVLRDIDNTVGLPEPGD